ncbi:MAG: SpoIID/LytB domain-containing protein [Lachnospiraceae bacterium]|nr:SpoIID/LytB domain-containing protein [Lachnospiraceae bacterium]
MVRMLLSLRYIIRQITRWERSTCIFIACKRFMKKQGKGMKKRWFVVLLFFVLLGIIGGLLIKYVFYGHVGNGTMKQTEANRLISYLGVSEYEYSDRLGSLFTVGDAKDLLECADVSLDQLEFNVSYLPSFVPLTKKQFESMYASLIRTLELDRLACVNLYIFDIDRTREEEIDGIIYEVIETHLGEYYMEKDYGMDHAYIGKVVKTYVSNNEIILCQGESNETVTIQNAYMLKSDKEDSANKNMLIAVNGNTYEMIPNKKMKGMQEESGLCDLTLSNEGVLELISHTKDLVETRVMSYHDGVMNADGYEEELYLSEFFNVYKVKGSFKATQSAGMLIGYEKVSLYIKDGIVEAALIQDDIYAKNIRVLINDSEYSSFYHNSVMITSDTDFTITYDDVVKEYKASEKVEFRNGSEELKKGPAIIQSKSEDGKIEIKSLNRQGGTPKYRGKLELTRDDKGVLVVNELSVEEYLYGVVPSEMPVTYEMEALKAQAICARAYAYRQMESEKYASYGAHLDDSVSCQVYNNVAEDERVIFAVDDTYGVVPCYDGEVIEAFFFSTSCGATSNNASVWGGYQKPYLLDSMQTEYNDIANLSSEENFRSFMKGELGTDFLEESEPFFRWTVEFTPQEITKAVNDNLYNRIQAMPEYILTKEKSGAFVKKDIASIGDVVDIEIKKRGDSGIIEEMIVTGTQETILVKGQTNARALLAPTAVTIKKQDGSTLTGWSSLPSAYYYVDYSESDGGTFIVSGGGFGHGVGMSQNGANQMAKLGYMACDIITHYYTAVELKDMYELLGK